MATTKAPKISVHRVRVPVTARTYDVQWDIWIDKEPFARCSSITQTWRCYRLRPYLCSGDFPTLAEAKSWGIEMARRTAGLSEGPVVSSKDQYGYERPIGQTREG